MLLAGRLPLDERGKSGSCPTSDALFPPRLFFVPPMASQLHRCSLIRAAFPAICGLVISLGAGLLSAADPLIEIRGCTLVRADWSDGDSFPVRTPEGKEMTVRLYGADCVEWHVSDPSDERRLREQRRYFGITFAGGDTRTSIDLAKGFGEKAADEVLALLARPFTVHTAFSDARGDGRYQRVYAFVITADGVDLAAQLVKKGLARAFGVSRETHDGRTQSDYREYLEDLELQAAKREIGVWSRTDWEKLPEERQTQRMEDRETEIALGKDPLSDGEKVNPNTAARDELMKLPGIGETIANRIIEGRPYRQAADLLRVSGIGETTLERIAPHLELSAR